MNSARRFATALHRCRHPLKLGGQQWRRRERRRQRRRRRRRRLLAGKRKSRRRRNRSSAHNSRRSRHTGRLSSRAKSLPKTGRLRWTTGGVGETGVWTSQSFAFMRGRGEEERVTPDLSLAASQRTKTLSDLADALGLCVWCGLILPRPLSASWR